MKDSCWLLQQFGKIYAGTKLCAPALAPFKAYYEGDGFPDVFDLSLMSHVKVRNINSNTTISTLKKLLGCQNNPKHSMRCLTC
ncbi:hypothetical protein MKW92_032412 [Papaver armeniacum]|nr:hypothetical protein MKW92_032412 [Papaver armeniacum]